MIQVCRPLFKRVLAVLMLVLLLTSFYSHADYFSEYDKGYNSGVAFNKNRQYQQASEMFHRAQGVVNKMQHKCKSKPFRRARQRCTEGLCRAKFFLSWHNTVTQYYLKNTRSVSAGYKTSAAAYFSKSRSGTEFICPGIPQKLGMTSLYQAALVDLRAGEQRGYQRYFNILAKLEKHFNLGTRYTSKLSKHAGGQQSTRLPQRTDSRYPQKNNNEDNQQQY